MLKSKNLISWNVNGIRAMISKNGFDWVKEQKPDFLFLQEIKAQPNDIKDFICVNEYKNFFVNSGQRKGYSGVASLFDDQPISTRFIEDIDTLKEGRILEHDFGDHVIFNVYFPNGQQGDDRLQYKMEFYDKFLNYCEELKAKGKGIIICGDVNTAHTEIDLANPKANSKTSGFLPIERAWIDKLLSHGYIDTYREVHGDIVDKYSWWSYRFNARAKNVGWRIDYFFISNNLKNSLEDAFICDDILGSDHCPVGIKIKL